MQPFGLQIVIYLFLAGIAAGAAFMGSFALAGRKTEPFGGGKRSLILAGLCALVGAGALILDLASPADFPLIVTQANPSSAISWGARILVLFAFSAFFVWATVRNWDAAAIERGFKGVDLIGLWLLRISALALAIYPAFVLRQGAAYPLWQHSLLVPLIVVSAFHAGVAGMLLVTSCADCKRKARVMEIILGTAQLGLLAMVFVTAGASAIFWIVALAVGTLMPLIFIFTKANLAAVGQVAVLVGAFAIRYWIIVVGQAV